ncbi:MAG: hypothetical protein ACM3Y9_13260 [Ignavibacteria bacterium]
MIPLLDDFQRRTRALVSAVGLLQRSEPASTGYGEFRRKTEKSVRLVIDTAGEVLRAAAPEASDRNGALDQARARGVLDAGEAERWSGYFDWCLPSGDAAYDEATLERLRALLLDARSLEASLRK